MSGAELQDWQLIDWRYVNQDVDNLRQRIFVASRMNDLKKVASLQKLMLRSRASWMWSIRRVTQINKGRRTPGVDREIITTPEERVKLFYWLESITLNEWAPPPTRRVEIPKGNGKTRPLGIPTIRDRRAPAGSPLRPGLRHLGPGLWGRCGGDTPRDRRRGRDPARDPAPPASVDLVSS